MWYSAVCLIPVIRLFVVERLSLPPLAFTLVLSDGFWMTFCPLFQCLRVWFLNIPWADISPLKLTHIMDIFMPRMLFNPTAAGILLPLKCNFATNPRLNSVSILYLPPNWPEARLITLLLLKTSDVPILRKSAARFIAILLRPSPDYNDHRFPASSKKYGSIIITVILLSFHRCVGFTKFGAFLNGLITRISSLPRFLRLSPPYLFIESIITDSDVVVFLLFTSKITLHFFPCTDFRGNQYFCRCSH